VYIDGDPALPENWQSSAVTGETPDDADRIVY